MVYILEKAGSRRRKETVTGTTLEELRWWDLEMGLPLNRRKTSPLHPGGRGAGVGLEVV